MFISYADKVNMHFTFSQSSCVEMGHWMVVSLFVFTISSVELKADNSPGTKELRDHGFFGKGKKNKKIDTLNLCCIYQSRND